MEESERRASRPWNASPGAFHRVSLADAGQGQRVRQGVAPMRDPVARSRAASSWPSAHWHTVRPLRVTGSQKPRQLHDYGDYPSWLNSMSYPCPGAPALANRVASLLQGAGTPAVVDMGQGLDFASWMPLSLLYASAKVPIVEVSLPAGGTPEDMMAVGRALSPAARRGIHDRGHRRGRLQPPSGPARQSRTRRLKAGRANSTTG